MLWLLDTGKMAKKFGKWRGAVTVACGVALSLVGVAFAKIDDLLYTITPALQRPVDGATLALIALVVYAVGMLICLCGAWQLYKDATRGTYQLDAERYDREGW